MAYDPIRKSWQAVTDVGWEHDQFAIYVWRSLRKPGDTKTVKSRRSLRIPVHCVTARKALLDERAKGESVGTFSESRVLGTRNETAVTAENVRRDLRIALKAPEASTRRNGHRGSSGTASSRCSQLMTSRSSTSHGWSATRTPS